MHRDRRGRRRQRREHVRAALKDEQVAAFRELCDGCYADSGCEMGAECAMYDDRVFRGEDVQ